MIHHMAIISAQIAGPQIRGSASAHGHRAHVHAGHIGGHVRSLLVGEQREPRHLPRIHAEPGAGDYIKPGQHAQRHQPRNRDERGRV